MVTGGASGVGLSTAQRLAREGAKAAAEGIRASGAEAQGLALDALNGESAHTLVNEAVRTAAGPS